MIGISTLTADTNGHAIIDTDIDIRDNTSRVSRVKTLDGGVVVTHSGYSDGDITVNIEAEISTTVSDTLWYIFRNHSYINLASKEGVFLSVIRSLKIDNGKMKMTILIKSRGSE